MQAQLPHYITPAEYLAGEETSSIKHEYYDGQIYAMAGGTNAHAILCSNTLIALGAQLLGKSCRAVSSEQRVKIEATGLHVYPDTSVYCQDARFDGAGDTNLLDPTVIVEVLSRSTSAYDRGDKFDHYKRIETLRDYILSNKRAFTSNIFIVWKTAIGCYVLSIISLTNWRCLR